MPFLFTSGSHALALATPFGADLTSAGRSWADTLSYHEDLGEQVLGDLPLRGLAAASPRPLLARVRSSSRIHRAWPTLRLKPPSPRHQQVPRTHCSSPSRFGILVVTAISAAGEEHIRQENMRRADP